MGKTKNGDDAHDGGGTAPPTGLSAEGLDAATRAASGIGRRGPAPVHLWNPPHCGAIDMRIARDGTWFHEGAPIGRPGMVRLFASIVRRDPEGFVLVTPVEKVSIVVDDAPFVAVDVERSDPGGVLTFRTTLDDEVTAGSSHPIRVARDPATGEPSPYVLVRGGLEARIDRKTFYRLVDLGEVAPHGGADWFGVRSGAAFFPIIPAADLPD